MGDDNKLAVMGSIISTALSEKDIQEQVNIIQRVMKQVMQKDVHYGVVPGCGNKPSLLKAGSEKILSVFRIGVDPVIEDLSTDDEVKYRVIAKGLYWPTGSFLGAGVGVASSNEEKYKWKAASCKEEYEATPETRRRIKFYKKDGKAIQIHQVRVNPSDVANTILKMAKKRAQIDMTLTVTGASDIFTQDIEELDQDNVPIPKGKPVVDMPKAAPQERPQPKMSPARMFALAKEAGVPLPEVKRAMKERYGKDKTEALLPEELDELVQWINDFAEIGKDEK